MIFLDLEDLLHVGRRTLGAEPVVRDHGLLASALVRPQVRLYGQEAYPTVNQKAGALLCSLARDQGLLDGNKRLALAATIAFLGVNGVRLGLSNEEAYELVVAVGTWELEDVPAIASVLAANTALRRARCLGK